MNTQIYLKTEGFTICFNVKSLKDQKGYVDTVISFQLQQYLGELLVNSTPRYLSVDDLQRTATYLEQHISNLKEDPNYDSDVFVPMQLGFQLRAFSGEICSEDDGDFSILFLVNLGPRGEDTSDIYVGGESVVRLKDVNAFITEIRQIAERIR